MNHCRCLPWGSGTMTQHEAAVHMALGCAQKQWVSGLTRVRALSLTERSQAELRRRPEGRRGPRCGLARGHP